MQTPFLILPSAIDSTECDAIIERGQTLFMEEAKTGITNSHYSSIRISNVGWFNRLDDYDIVNMIMEYGKRYSREICSYAIEYINDIQFTQYIGKQENGGKYDWHFDMFFDNVKPFDRKISFILQLSDPVDYSGGLLEFQDPYYCGLEPSAYSQRGTIIMFPSFVPHRVTPVTSGMRYSLVSWIEGPKFR